MLVTPVIFVPLIISWFLIGGLTANAFRERDEGVSVFLVIAFLMLTIILVMAVVGAATM